MVPWSNRAKAAWKAPSLLFVALAVGVPACRQKPRTPSEDVKALLVRLGKEQRTTSAGRVRARCDGADADPCACVESAVREALDDAATEVARALILHDGKACAAPLSGEEAETDARAGAKGADAKAKAVLAVRPGDPYATYALAHLAWMSGDRIGAAKWADAAVSAGRESPAHLVVGLLALDRGELEAARGAFLRVLDREPADVAALYDAALCDHRLNHYRAAREGYLSVLRKNPRHLDARYNLVVLTLNAGFREEASHHLAELERISPGDPRIARLDAMMAAATPSASAAPVPSPSGAAAAAPAASAAAVPSPSGAAAGAPAAPVPSALSRLRGP
ncbi:MAG TPA: hypothetical protein VHE30_13925 [Polyangiaceae bacterium]|nr:hypothetical protein [Polyangiaceae bacterium]